MPVIRRGTGTRGSPEAPSITVQDGRRAGSVKGMSRWFTATQRGETTAVSLITRGRWHCRHATDRSRDTVGIARPVLLPPEPDAAVPLPRPRQAAAVRVACLLAATPVALMADHPSSARPHPSRSSPTLCGGLDARRDVPSCTHSPFTGPWRGVVQRQQRRRSTPTTARKAGWRHSRCCHHSRREQGVCAPLDNGLVGCVVVPGTTGPVPASLADNRGPPDFAPVLTCFLVATTVPS